MDQLIKWTGRITTIVAVGLIASCAGPEGKQGATGPAGNDGTPGAAGANGQPCTVANYDGGVTVTCPGSSPVNVPNGANGAPCSVAQIDGGVTVTCPGSTPVTVFNGTSGPANGRAPVEQCLICHGPGTIAPITLMHNGQKELNPIAGLNVTISSVTGGTGGAPVVVNFALTDDRGAPIDLNGKYSINTPFIPRFALARVETTPLADGGFIMLPYKVISKSGSATAATTTDPAPDPTTVVVQPTAFSPSFPAVSGDAAMKGVLVEVGTKAGTYSYTFPTGGNTDTVSNGKHVRTVVNPVLIDPTKLNDTHTVWMQTARQWDLVFTSNLQTFKAVDTEFNFIPAGAGTPVARRIISQAACDKCHNGFKRDLNPNLTLPTVNGFHGGGRVEGPFCNVCHNPDRVSNPAANSAVFVHRLHGSHKLVANPDGGVPVNAFHGIQVSFPQDVRNCDVCHAGAAQGWQATALPTKEACGSCHDAVDFGAASALPTCTNPATLDADGRFVPCAHKAGAQADNSNCATCHGGSTSVSPIVARHLAVLPPDPKAPRPGALADGGWGLPDGGAGSGNVNAAYIAAAKMIPPGAYATKYVIQSVGLSTANHPKMVFKLQQSLNGTAAYTDVDFGTPGAGKTELIDNFVGGPSAYFVWAMPQDGIAAPADFNASASCYIKNAWNGTATSGTSACTLSAKDGSGFYTVEMTNITIPATAKMLTGGLGYTYNVTSARPLTQTNLGAYPYSSTTGLGGLIVAAPNVSMVATNFTARRAIVETARCNNCHAQLGVGPTFHAGQRNDAASCSFCHNPNRTSSAWSANAKDFIHSIHGGRIRTVPFNWHAISESENFSEVEFPSNVNNCESCHLPGTYDFTQASTVNALPNMLVSTVAQGKYDRNPLTNPTGWYSIAPASYVLADNVYNYGVGFSFNGQTGVTTPPSATTLVKTPITAACSACHDASPSVAHMENMGGSFYRPRSQVFVP